MQSYLGLDDIFAKLRTETWFMLRWTEFVRFNFY